MRSGLFPSHPPSKRQGWCGSPTPPGHGTLAQRAHQAREFETQVQAPGSSSLAVVGSRYLVRLMCVLSTGFREGVEVVGDATCSEREVPLKPCAIRTKAAGHLLRILVQSVNVNLDEVVPLRHHADSSAP